MLVESGFVPPNDEVDRPLAASAQRHLPGPAFSEMLGTTDVPPKVDDALRLFEAKRSVRGMSDEVLHKRIGGKLAAALGRSPAVDLGDQRTRDTLSARDRVDVQPFEKCERRATRTVDIVDAFRSLNKAGYGVGGKEGEADAIPSPQNVGHLA